MKIVLRLIGLVFIIVIVLLGGITVFAILHKQEISKSIAETVNRKTHADIHFASIDFSPISSFPLLAVSLNDIVISEKQVDHNGLKPMIELKSLHLGINILELFRQSIDVKQLVAKEGFVYLDTDEEGALNFIRIFQGKDHHVSKALTESRQGPAKDTVSSRAMKLSVEHIKIEDVEFRYYGGLEDKTSHLFVDELDAFYQENKDSIFGIVETKFKMYEAGFSGLPIANEAIQLNAELNYNRIDSILKVYEGGARIGLAEIGIVGKADLSSRQFVDFELSAKDKGLGLTSLFLNKRGVSNISNGSIHFNASVKGHYKNQLPDIECRFGIDNLKVNVPKSEASINKLHLSGSFRSGSELDFSEAKMQIDTLHGDLPGGFINAKLLLSNFQSPRLVYNVDIASDLEGLDKILYLDFIEGLGGAIEIKDSFKGSISDKTVVSDQSGDAFSFRMKDVAFNMPGLINVQNLSGEIAGFKDSIIIRDLSVLSDQSNLTINGFVKGAMYFLFPDQKMLYADLAITGKRFNLPVALGFDPRIGQSFPYTIDDVDLQLRMQTNWDELTGDSGEPHMVFEIDKLQARPNGFLPFVKLRNGRFDLFNKDESAQLVFEHFEADVAGSRLKADVKLGWEANDPINYDIEGELFDFNLMVLDEAYNIDKDTSVVLINGAFSFEAGGSNDSIKVFDSADLHLSDLLLFSPSDTIYAETVKLSVDSVVLGDNKNRLRSAALSSAKLEVNSFVSDKIQFPNLVAHCSLNEGVFSGSEIWFSNLGRSNGLSFKYDVQKPVPELTLKSEIEQMKLQRVFTFLKQDTVISGDVDLNLNVSMAGSNLKQMVSTLNGELLIEGSDLKLHGIELDPLIDKFKRSQTFNLVDVGAVMFAGPAGLAVTKGSDYTRMLVNNGGEYTSIPQLNSDWTFDQGKISISDVAMATEHNRMAAHGEYDFNSDEINFSIALIDKDGCVMASQDIAGQANDPKYSRVKIIETILAPVKNLLKDATATKCDPFYTGKVKHPTDE